MEVTLASAPQWCLQVQTRNRDLVTISAQASSSSNLRQTSSSSSLSTGILLRRFTGDAAQLTGTTYSLSSFKGDDTTFGDFPSRLQHILSETVQGTVIESIVFPAYDVRLVLAVFLIHSSML